ncbi:MAG: hypothetical protein ACLR7P_01990 [Faecalibacterium sp.]
MIELPITLTSGGSVCLPGRAYALALGYTKNRGVYRLAVTATGEWEGLAIRCFWHIPDGKDPESSLVEDGYVAVPASVTAQPGSGCVTFEGSDGAKVMTSADLRYRVSANSGTEDGTEPEPGTPAWQQLVDAVHTDATAAEQSKTDAQTAAQQSEASAQKAGRALADTVDAKEDALKAIGDKQTAATQAVDTARDKALQQVETSTEAAETAASEAATSAGNASQSAQKAAGSLQELKEGIAAGDFKGEPGNDGKSPVVTVTDIENGHRVSITDKDGTKTIDVLNGQTGKTGATPVLTIGTVSSGDKPSAYITGTPENPVLNLRLQPGPQGPAVALDATLAHEGEAADAKATGDAISAVKARQNIIVGSEIGNPISVDDAFPAPLCGLTVYGKSTQSGTPTPDAPVPIVSAGDGGSLTVKVTGKNRMPPNLKYGDVLECFVKKNTPITLVFKGDLVSQGGNILFFDENNNQKWFGIDAGKAEHHIQYPVDLTKFQYLLSDMASENVCLTWNASSPDYEPYREQLLTLPTPTGLPGIPVTSGGNYADSTGQQWACDEVDLERGVKVQRVNAVDLSTCTVTGTTEFAVTKRLSIRLPIRGRDYKTEALCNKLQFLVSFSDDTPHFYVDTSNAQVFIPIGAKNPEEGEYILFYVLATPIETPLTPDELATYSALTAYGPDTVVQASDGAGIKLDYQRDVNLVVKNLEDAIASMT